MTVRSWDPSPYPVARKREAGATAQAGDAPVAIPLASPWAFALREVADGATSGAVSRLYHGPVFVRELSYYVRMSAAASGFGRLVIRFSHENSGRGSLGINAAFPQGIDLLESDGYSDGLGSNNLRTGVIVADTAGEVHDRSHTFSIGRWINQSEVYFKAIIAARSGVVNLAAGVLSVYENVEPELLPALY